MVRALPYPLSGRALLDLGLGRSPAALAGAEEAVELSREMVGGAMLASSLAALAQVEAALGRPEQTRAQPTPWAALTAAETRVAQVILEGATYNEAANALFVSPRTIETHLRQIYRKVGVRSRSELSRRLAVTGSAM